MRADFVSQAYFRNPAAEIEKLRSAGPVVEVQFPMIGKVWTTTTQDLADRVLKDSETFTIRTGIGGVAGLQWWMPRILRTLANHMLSMDEPDHRRLRDIVDEAFRRRAVLEMEPRILAIAEVVALRDHLLLRIDDDKLADVLQVLVDQAALRIGLCIFRDTAELHRADG